MDANRPPSYSDPASPDLDLPAGLRAQLEAFRRTLWRTKVQEAVAAAALGLLWGFLLVFFSDRFWDTPAGLRAAILLASTAGAALFAPCWLHRWIWGHRDPAQLADLISRRFPDLGDRLLGTVELARGGAAPDCSVALCRAAIGQVAEEASGRDLSRAVPLWHHRGGKIALGVAGALALVALLLAPSAGSNAIARWLRPFGQVERYTFTRLAPAPERLVVAYGEPFSLAFQLGPDTVWEPGRGSARYGSQAPVAALNEGGLFRFVLPGQTHGATLRVAVGDARAEVEVVPLVRPELTGLTGRVEPPAYLGHPAHEQEVIDGRLQLLDGSRVSFSGQVSRVLDAARMGDLPLEVVDQRFTSPPVSLGAAAGCAFSWVDVEGLAGKAPFEVAVDTVRDEPPFVGVTGLPRAVGILQEEVLSFEASGHDDYGVKEVGVRWEFTPAVGSEGGGEAGGKRSGAYVVGAGGQRVEQVVAPAHFSPAALGLGPGTVALQVTALDYFPGREASASSTYTIYILDRTQHALIIEQEFSKVLGALEEIARTEESLHDTNLEIDQLDPVDLAQNDAGERLEDQAGAEAANRDALEQLREDAADLLQDALRNGDIDPAALERWSEMLELMREVAAEDMPRAAAALSDAAAPPSGPLGRKGPLGEALQAQKTILAKLGRAVEKGGETEQLLRAGTFVNRLRRAAEIEFGISGGLKARIAATIGLPAAELRPSQRSGIDEIGRSQEKNGAEVGAIQSDLEHSFRRSLRPVYQEVANLMEKARVVEALADLAGQISANRAGRAITHAEHWAAELNAWADRLAGPPPEGGGGGGGGGEPDFELLFKLLKLAQEEGDLRARTRALEAAPDRGVRYRDGALFLAEEQERLAVRAREISRAYDIPKLHQLLALVDRAMGDAQRLLEVPDTGGETVAAETEVIELLAQACQGCCGGGTAGMAGMMQMMAGMGMGGAPGFNPGGGPSDAPNQPVGGPASAAEPGQRRVEKASGTAGDPLPAEFRQAISAYLEAVGDLGD